MRELFVTKILSFFIEPNAASKTDSLLLRNAPSCWLLMVPVAMMLAGCMERMHLAQRQLSAVADAISMKKGEKYLANKTLKANMLANVSESGACTEHGFSSR